MSPVLIAWATPWRLQSVGRWRRSRSPSSMSSWTRLKLWPSSTARRRAARASARRRWTHTREARGSAASACRPAHRAGRARGGSGSSRRRRASRRRGRRRGAASRPRYPRSCRRGRGPAARSPSRASVRAWPQTCHREVACSRSRYLTEAAPRACYRRAVPSRLYATDAIVLSRFDLGEADRVLTLLAPELGKFKAIAKGIRRPSSRLGGSLEPFAELRVNLARGRTFDVVTGVSVGRAFLRLRDS